MVKRMGDRTINMRVLPCCCLCCLPKAAPFTRRTIQMLKACVTQVPYIQAIMIFLLVVFSLTRELRIGSISPSDPYFAISLILIISFLIGRWALHVLFRIEKDYDFLQIHQYMKKARLIEVMITLSNLQIFLIDSLATNSVIPCGGHLISPNAMGGIIKSILVMVETLSLGSYMFKLYMDDTEHV